MPSAVILTTVSVDVHRLEDALARAGHTMVWDARGCLLSRDDTTITVHDSTATVHDLPDRVAAAARTLLGRRPKMRLTCQYEVPATAGPGTAAGGAPVAGASGGDGDGGGWGMVVDVARAVAGRVPLAVLVDSAGAVRLVHPERGLVTEQQYEAEKRPNPVADLLRRFLGEGR